MAADKRKTASYHPESYWSDVAERIEEREGEHIIAGDDEPFYRYKRKKFLELLHEIDFSGKSVLEIGSGPGGNLNEIWEQHPARLVGADISQSMIDLAGNNKFSEEIELVKIDGRRLPFETGAFDIVLTVTVLQHNTEDDLVRKILSEICRVSGKEVYLFERIEPEVMGDSLCMGRPVSYYSEICARNNFELEQNQFINIRSSYYMAGFTRKMLNPPGRKEGEPLTKTSLAIQNVLLPITGILDTLFSSSRDLAKLSFVKRS